MCCVQQEAEQGSPLELETAALQAQEREAASWGDALAGVSQSLTEGRRRLWEEAARKLGALLAAPAAFQGEHFLQVRACPAPLVAHRALSDLSDTNTPQQRCLIYDRQHGTALVF